MTILFYKCWLQFKLQFVFLVFPDDCTSYDGPHSRKCLTPLWLEGGCLADGYLAPNNMSELEYTLWKDLPFEYVGFFVDDEQSHLFE